MWIEPETLAPVAATLEKSGYVPFSSPGERHGSWEWLFYRESEGLTRFVVLAATPVGPGETVELEVWIGAEADQRFTRQRTGSLVVTADRFPSMLADLITRAKQAASRASALRWSDLNQAYLHSPQGRLKTARAGH